MKPHTDLAQVIAHWLSGLWQLWKSEAFQDYVATTYGVNVNCSPTFECIYIAESDSGSLDRGEIGSIIKRWWVLDDGGLAAIKRPTLPSADDASAVFDQRPVVKFFTDGDQIVIGERLGPNLICRKKGKIVITDTGPPVVDVRVFWTASD